MERARSSRLSLEPYASVRGRRASVEKSWHPEVTAAAWHAVSRKSLLAGFYLLKEIWAGEKPNLLPFPCSIPSRPPPPPPPGVSAHKHPSGGQNSSHKIRLERSHEPLNLNTKGKTSLK